MTMPDPIELVVSWLTTGEYASEVSAVVGTRILSRTGDPLPSRPFVRLDLAGGRPIVDERFDSPRIQVHVFGDPESEPATLAAAQTIRAALVAARAETLEPGVLGRCWVESGPAVIYDDTHEPPLVDVTFAVRLTVRPH